MSMIHPGIEPFPPPVTEERNWQGPTALALVVTALGAAGGATFAALLEAAAADWAETAPPLAPLMALLAAGSVYGRYRHRSLDQLQSLIARALVTTAGAMMLVAVILGELRLAAVAMWFMAAVTVIVTALAAGAGSSAGRELPAPSRGATLPMFRQSP